MKLIINNSNHILENAFFKENIYSFQLFINTRHNWVIYNHIESSRSEFKIFYGQRSKDSIILKAETKHDMDIFNRFRFECHDKWQLWIIFLADEIINT